MESKAKYGVSKAGSSKVRFLAFVFALGLIAHGLFFPIEIIAMAFVMMVALFVELRGSGDEINIFSRPLGGTDILLVSLVGLSLLGLQHPVKTGDAWLEAIRYVLYWVMYRWGMALTDMVPGSRWVRRAGWVALFLAVAGALPFAQGLGPTTGLAGASRLNSFFGYANATATFLAAVLLLPGLNAWLKPILFLALLGTGSRGVLGLFALFKTYDLWQGLRNVRRASGIRVFKKWKDWRLFPVLILGTLAAGVLLPAVTEWFHQAFKYLSAWPPLDRSWGERFLYLKDGFGLAWRVRLWPQAGGWLAFPLVQEIPYWTSDPHSSVTRVLLNQGLIGLLSLGVWTALWIHKTWRGLRRESWGVRGAERQTYFRVCLFLMFHSLIDADFSFPVLGLIFWFLCGSMAGAQRLPSLNLSGNGWLRQRAGALTGLVLGCLMVLVGGFFSSSPGFGLTSTRVVAGAGEIENWERVLHTDQTSWIAHQSLAEAEFRRGNWEGGLRHVEQVLAWRKFDLGAYEWAQNVVWQATQSGRKDENMDVLQLYAWIEGVPTRVNTLAEQVPQYERWLWEGYKDFHSTPHLQWLASYASERTFQPQ